MKAPRVPKSINLGYGNIIKVRLVSQSRMKLIGRAEEPLDGMWDDVSRTMYIDKNLSAERRKQTFYHEMLHVINDVAALGSDIHL